MATCLEVCSGMTGGRVVSSTLLAVLMALPSPCAARQDPSKESQGAPRFKSAVDVVSVAAVVRDRKGRFVSDLSKEDFQIVEAGEPRKILDFRAEANGPVKVALLVDISGSMRVGSRVVDAKQGAMHVFAGLRPIDQAAIFTFDTGLDQVTPFTSDRAKLEAALETAQQPYGQTSLYDATARVARSVAQESRIAAGLPQRAAVVVLTDGIDTRSQLTPEQVASIASGIDVPVYIIAVMAKIDDPRERSEDDAGGAGLPATRLQELAQRTGGELFLASAPAHASVAARRILGEMRHQYVLAFEASTRPGWRPLEVRAKDYLVRARSGYTAGGTGTPMTSGER